MAPATGGTPSLCTGGTSGTLITTMLARVALAVLAAIALAGLFLPQGESTGRSPGQNADITLYSNILQRLQAGDGYYQAVGAELRAGGYATKPVVNWRTPLHLVATARLGLGTAGLLLAALAILVVLGSVLVYAGRSPGAAILGPVFALGAALPALVSRPGGVVFAETWAGTFIALSVVAYYRGWWIGGALLGVVAVFLRELAVPYVLVCGLLAIRSRRRAESVVWIIAGAAYVAYYVVHATIATHHLQPGDLTSHSWIQVQGFSFLFATLRTNAWLLTVPTALLGVVVATGLAGACARSAPRQLAVAVVVYAALFAIVGQPVDYYWGFITAPLWAFAAVHAREGLARVIAAAR